MQFTYLSPFLSIFNIFHLYIEKRLFFYIYDLYTDFSRVFQLSYSLFEQTFYLAIKLIFSLVEHINELFLKIKNNFAQKTKQKIIKFLIWIPKCKT